MMQKRKKKENVDVPELILIEVDSHEAEEILEFCPSCRNNFVQNELVKEPLSDSILCRSCFDDWSELYLAGIVRYFDDIVPKGEC
ncbi:MAG: hypothetical protein A3G32_05175 [Deltaproteobacteria bacterium RIFCSPLOWO2_12_FULL_40_28]|nr:MAG: hypothetical protein A3C45_09285 [Deltaproteobacteria bacterium RIFCSPHIGHO2_02_FULL_40_28]OGQ19753.1 MAG: hypothetical protein A3E27_08480 [Deltaproteobacteria bacterium RIFCSPHIGHO2_12_FULL_40_32]OGQ41030.1 MAG: hypothetical protein A3I69_03895 [Deltaproteobacteria bacterium RIFCSPLOWO2_02_FULL_40_36]OGQ54146.1 MAG: hypothetical protein A3G32_05175 [Deltaproteobacteria bacterium RIFCSPLOWO2_12_FULL_40_28]